MGKAINIQYSDLNSRILKNSKKRKNWELGKISKIYSDDRDTQEPLLKKQKRGPRLKDQKNLKAAQVSTSVSDEVTATEENFLHLQIKGTDTDLFSTDEVRSSQLSYICKDFYFHIIEEICLEGLDGITLEAFWKRFFVAIECPFSISDSIKEIIWEMIRDNEIFIFYALKEERGELLLTDKKRDKRGIVIQPLESTDIYPISVVQDSTNRGSCSTYHTRVDVSEKIRKLDLQSVEKEYGRKLVIMANQDSRNKILFYDEDPLVDLQLFEYCLLERIGRSRKVGEMTQSNCSITAAFKIDGGSLFHYQKVLKKNCLIKKQKYYIKDMISDQYKSGNIVHLTRFYKRIKSLQLLIAERVVNILKSKPNYRIAISDLRKMFPFFEPTMKVMKNPEFRKFIKEDTMYPYREIYPNATQREYSRKSDGQEKHIRCYELINPHVNVGACWHQNANEDSDEEEDEEDEEVTGGNKMFNVELFREVYYHIFSKGIEGISQMDLMRLIGVDKNSIRMALKKLLSKKVIFIKKCDIGKQRKLLYYTQYSKNPNTNSTELNVSAQDKPNQKVSKFKAKLIEKQRAALVKTNHVENIDEILNIAAEIHSPFCKFQTLKAPPESVVISYLVKEDWKFSELMDTSDINIFPKLIKNFSVPLTFVSTQEELFQINKYLSDINIVPDTFQIKIHENSLTETKKIDKVMKLILLKAHFGEIRVKDVINYVNRKRPHSEIESPVTEKQINYIQNKRLGVGSLNFMGDAPSMVFENIDNGLHVIIYQSTPPTEFNYNTTYPHKIDISKRMMSRCQLILDVINQKKIQEECYKLVKYISAEEAKEGIEEKIDKKTVARLLRKLVIEGYIKVYELVASNNLLKKSTYFYCHPTITYTDPLIEGILEQWKWKYFYSVNVSEPEPAPVEIKKDPEDQSVLIFKEFDVLESIQELNGMNKPDSKVHAKFIRQMSKVHGLKPKCIRMRILHEFLFYLIYESKQQKQPLNATEVKNLFSSYLIDISQEDLNKMPAIYCSEISWKMFIPRLPQHKGWSEGWTLLCDVILRLPVSIFCQIYGCSYKLQELDDVLNHPIKRFYLLKDLSYEIRNVLLINRKYLTSIYDTLDRLAFCGLLQYGPQKSKIKDQAFVYLNRKASLLDTTSSEPSYFKITEKEYPQLNFYFNGQPDLDNYWYNVYIICLNTKLNKKKSGQIITLVDLSARPDLQAALVHKTTEEVQEYDIGKIYGDKRGAAGFDSSLWAHLTRNWFWPSRKKFESPDFQGLENEKLDKVLPHQIEYSNLHQNSWSKIFLTKDKPSTSKLQSTTKSIIRTKTSKTFQKLVRRIMPRSTKSSKRAYYDTIDMVIRKQNGIKTRVKFSQNEDDYLLLSLAAEHFLTPKAVKKRAISFTLIRDILHRICPESKNKTSRAIQRRLKILLNQHTVHFEENVCNFMKIKEIKEYFLQLCGRNKKVQVNDLEIGVAFIFLMSYIIKHKNEFMSILRGINTMTDYLMDSNIEYVENNMIELEEDTLKFSEPKDDNDIKKDVLKSVIHSSLAIKKQPELALQLFKIYQQYSDDLIRMAVNELKESQTISSKKFESKKNRIFWQIPFKFSRVYITFQYATFNNTTAIQAYNTLLSALNNEFRKMDFSYENIESKKYGQLLSINELFTIWPNISLCFDLPQNMVILNPSIKDHHELINELAVRYQLQLQNMVQDNIREGEQEQEIDKHGQTEMEISTSEECKKSSVSKIKEFEHELIDLTEDAPLDMSIGGGPETIDRLKTWVTDCMEEQRERSPSPQFFQIKEEPGLESDGVEVEESDVDLKDNFVNLSKGSNHSQIPTLEEIKEGMLKPSTIGEERTIPYITELSGLLNKETFGELNVDEKRLEQLKNHFITHLAKLESLVVNDLDRLKDMSYLDHTGHSKLWNKIQKDIIVDRTMMNIFEFVEENGGTDDDCALAIDLIEFIKQKESLGATGQEIKEQFSNVKRSLELVDILQILIDARILLKTGICKLRFVHFKYQCSWLIETFELSEEEKILDAKNQENGEEIEDKEIMEQKLKKQKLMNIKVAPWIKIDGHLHEDILKTWLCNILSHTLEYPKISFVKICKKFPHVKPIDIYYLLEILQQLDCIDLFLYENKNYTLFSSWEVPAKRHATILDDLEHVIVEPNSRSMTCLGSFFYHLENKSI